MAASLSILGGTAVQNSVHNDTSTSYGFEYTTNKNIALGYLNLGHPSTKVKGDGIFLSYKGQVKVTKNIIASIESGPFVSANTVINTNQTYSIKYNTALLISVDLSYNVYDTYNVGIRGERLIYQYPTDVDIFLLKVSKSF